MLDRLVQWWKSRREQQEQLHEIHEDFINKSRAILAVSDKLSAAIKDGNLERAQELRSHLNSLPCPMCKR